MKRGIGGNEHDLIRLLNGELRADEARALEERVRTEPELAEAWRRLERTWRSLEPPPSAPVPPGFTGRVMVRVRNQSAPSSLSWASAPGWVRATAAAALIAGAALGIGVGRSLPMAEAQPAVVSEVASDSIYASDEEHANLTETYWSLVEDTTGSEEAMP